MNRPAPLLLAGLALLLASPAGAQNGAPSRKAGRGCAWEKLADAKLGLAAWVQRCDYGFRKIDFLIVKRSLAVRFSDGGGPDPLVDVFDLEPGEAPAAGIQRLFKARTDPKLAARCVLAPYRGSKAPAGVQRFTFVPNAAYLKQLAAKADPNEVGDPPCGDWGDAPDGIQYFEAQPASGARKVLFVRVGQDEPLFDEQTLRLLPP
ncbi:MAG TPA: hypothetical protein VKY89_13835 [Thermoanaerobaculia bacterium]|nr:hypothetical protein [Thermoanaerobaculia bacterium]